MIFIVILVTSIALLAADINISGWGDSWRWLVASATSKEKPLSYRSCFLLLLQLLLSCRPFIRTDFSTSLGLGIGHRGRMGDPCCTIYPIIPSVHPSDYFVSGCNGLLGCSSCWWKFGIGGSRPDIMGTGAKWWINCWSLKLKRQLSIEGIFMLLAISRGC